MKIKISKDYSLMQLMYEHDAKRLPGRESVSFFSDYGGTWEEADVTQEQLEEYISKGYAIRINC